MAWAALAGLGLGLLNQRQQAEQEKQDRILAAQTQALSPWTGLQADKVKRAPGLLQAGAEGGLQGAAFGQSLDAAGMDEELRKQQLEGLKSQNSYWRQLLGQGQSSTPMAMNYTGGSSGSIG